MLLDGIAISILVLSLMIFRDCAKYKVQGELPTVPKLRPVGALVVLIYLVLAGQMLSWALHTLHFLG